MKNILFVIAFCGMSFCTVAQTMFSIESGYVGGKRQDFLFDSRGNNVVNNFPINGINLMLGVEQYFNKKIGLTVGFEYSKVNYNSIFTNQFVINSTGLPIFTQTKIIETRTSIKGGFVFTVVQKHKLTWKIMPLSNIYIPTFSDNKPQSFFDDTTFLGFTLKNSLQYRYSDDIQILFTQAYDLSMVFDEDYNRFIFNVGVGFDLD